MMVFAQLETLIDASWVGTRHLPLTGSPEARCMLVTWQDISPNDNIFTRTDEAPQVRTL
ncbi:hypothetical protein GJAV_G00271130 [Gymnothorax javanicus]|nr:hypothetical protein GJAV_G00271130 [Gymnothorax javanicus]